MTTAPPPDRSKRWPRDVWMDAIWDCEEMPPAQRAMAYAYARYAGSGDVTWCSEEELKKRTGIPSRSGIWSARKGLIDSGWLVETEKARQHRSARYRMVVVTAQVLADGASGKPDARSESIPDALSQNPDARSENTDARSASPISLTDYSNGSLGAGATLPPDPLRQTTPSGRSHETATSPIQVVTDKGDSATQLTTRGNVVEFASRKNRTSKASNAL